MQPEESNKSRSELASELGKHARLKECFLEGQGNCSKKIKRAHSLQLMGPLTILEDEVNGNNKVYALNKKIKNQKGNLELAPVGKRQASTFLGFCEHHDLIFQPIENNPDSIDLNDDYHCFLLSLRALALSYYRNKMDVRLFSNKDPEVRHKIAQLTGNSDINTQLKAAELALRDLEIDKERFIESLNSENYSQFEFLECELPYTIPVATAMAASPLFYFNRKPMNFGVQEGRKYSSIFTSVIPLSNRSIILLAAFKHEKKAIRYLDELSEMADIPFQKAMTWHLLTTVENVFFSPNFYDNLRISKRSEIAWIHNMAGDVNRKPLKFNKSFDLNFFAPHHALN